MSDLTDLDEPVDVLLVTHSAAGRSDLFTSLQALNFTATRIELHGPEFMHMARRPCALILIDGGIVPSLAVETVRRLRRQPPMIHTPIVFATNAGDMEELGCDEDLGPIDFLPMPASPATLRAKVRLHADLSRREAASKQRSVDMEREAANIKAAAQRRHGEFLAMLSHDLRNPLAALRNSVEVIRLLAPPLPKLTWATDVTGRQVNRLTALASDMLDIALIGQGKMTLQCDVVDVAALLEAAANDEPGSALSARRIQVALSLPTSAVTVSGDAARLRQVVDSLLTQTGRQLSEDGCIDLALEVCGQDVHITFSDRKAEPAADTSPGEIGATARLSNPQARASQSTGWVLAEHLVELHGGRIDRCDSGAGIGFVVSLPHALPSPLISPQGAQA